MKRIGKAIFALSALGLAGCEAQEAPQNDAAAAASSSNAASGSAGNMSAPSSTLWNGGAAKPLDIQIAHPNGTVLQVTSLQSRQTDTAVGIRVINGRTRDIDLNRFPNNRDSFLLLESGERLYLSPPVANARLTVPAGKTFEGELVFLGRLPPVPSGVMVLNDHSTRDSEYSTTPGFRVDLPLTGAAQ